ncbi:MAG: hypothetical protein GX621_14180 [Pirellulaceae bacterium]|nr:hypothetical protein [Pirellulaceae bacterium]
MTSRRRSFIRKIIYVCCLVPLVFLLYWLGSPRTIDTAGAKGSPGGVLAQIRTEEKIEQVHLGKIDPASESLRLAMLGMRGIAANILWTKSIEFKKTKDWTNYSATLNQIIKLQPNFIEVWRHQGWNLSYNCSAEFDDYRERYRWVIRGIEFLQLGTQYNEREPRLLRDIGWSIGQKIGRSDERVQFRRLFKDDDIFNKDIPRSRRDNWLVGKEWFRKAERLIDSGDASARGREMGPLVFRSQAPMSQMNCAAALAEDGIFGERLKNEWRQAAKDWEDFGRFGIRTSTDIVVQLGQFERLVAEQQSLVRELDSLAPGVREKLYQDRFSQLTDEQRDAWATPESQRSPEQRAAAAQASALLQVFPHEVERNRDVPRENRPKAREVLTQIEKLDEQLRLTNSYRQVVNYDYWKLRADIEQEEGMLSARKNVFQAREALAKGDLPGALAGFDEGSRAWARMLHEYPMLMSDKATSDDIEDLLEEYGRALDQCDQLFAPDFALAPFVRFQVEDNFKRARIRLDLAKALEAEAAGDLATAANFQEKALESWKTLLADVPSLEQASDRQVTEEILATIRKYADTVRKIDRPISDSFLLHGFVRVQMEHDPQTRLAQEAIESGQMAAEDGKLEAAQKAYEQAFTLWREVLDRYPTVLADSTVGEELIALIDQYRELLEQRKEEMPKEFILQDVVERYGQ